MQYKKYERWMAMVLAFLLCISFAAFSLAEEDISVPEEVQMEEEIVEAIQLPEPTPAPADSESDQLAVLDVVRDPVAMDVPLFTPMPSLENNPGFVMGSKSEEWGDLHLDSGSLRIPSDGMPIPQIFQYNYRKMVCTLDGVNKSVASSGCGAVAASMMIAYVRRNYNQTPYSLFYWAVEQGWYQGDGLHYEAIRKMLSNYGVDSHLADVSSAAIKSALKSSLPIIIKMGPGTFTNAGHYIVLRGLDEDGRVLVNDPNSSGRSEESYAVGQIVRECKSPYMLVVHARPEHAVVKKAEKPAAEAAVQGVEMSVAQDSKIQNPYYARVRYDNVNLRKSPITGTVVTSVKKGNVLNVIGEVTAEGQLWCVVDHKGTVLYIRGDMITALN